MLIRLLFTIWTYLAPKTAIVIRHASNYFPSLLFQIFHHPLPNNLFSWLVFRSNKFSHVPQIVVSCLQQLALPTYIFFSGHLNNLLADTLFFLCRYHQYLKDIYIVSEPTSFLLNPYIKIVAPSYSYIYSDLFAFTKRATQ